MKRTKEEILLSMVETMPHEINSAVKPYLMEAMDIYAKQEIASLQSSTKELPSDEERYCTHVFSSPFRVGKKQKTVVLDSKGLVVTNFEHHGGENQAQKYVNYLNGDHLKASTKEEEEKVSGERCGACNNTGVVEGEHFDDEQPCRNCN